MATHIGRDTWHLAWDATIPPALEVDSGDIVTFDVLDASCGQITAASTVADLAALDFSRVDQVAGPIAVEGAQPGDTLEVELLEVVPADWGWTAAIPGFGLLDGRVPRSRVAHHPSAWTGGGVPAGRAHPRSRRSAGSSGWHPAGPARSTIPPTETGGNMDTRHLTAGSRLWLPVQVPGALFSLGDGHAAQGDGEVCGTAIETPVRVTVRLTIRRDVRVTAPGVRDRRTAGRLHQHRRLVRRGRHRA